MKENLAYQDIEIIDEFDKEETAAEDVVREDETTGEEETENTEKNVKRETVEGYTDLGDGTMLSNATGEVVNGKLVLMPYGTACITPDAQEAHRALKQEKEERKAKRKAAAEAFEQLFGQAPKNPFKGKGAVDWKAQFLWMTTEALSLKPQTLARIVYLATSIKYIQAVTRNYMKACR